MTRSYKYQLDNVATCACLFSDFPGILSGDKIAFLDPHMAYFQYQEGNLPPRLTSSRQFIMNSHEMRKFPHQFEPFKQKLFGSLNLNQWYNGTVFRFPLRQDGSRSMVSSTVYNDQKMKQMLTMLQSEAHSLILFLNSVESIEWYEKSSPSDEPRLMFAVKVGDHCRQSVRRNRASFLTEIQPFTAHKQWKPASTHVTYEMTTSVKNMVRGQQSLDSKRWLVTQHFQGGSHAPQLKRIMTGGASKLLPWVGVALPLGEDNGYEPQGQLFCFLPLPDSEDSDTGFHFHVNGYFAVSQNR